MDIDQRIKRELESESAEIDRILADEKSLFGMLARVYRGGLRRWVILVTLVGIFLTAFIVWSAYRFFTAPATDELVFWGVIFLVGLQALGAMKLWIFMEMNRSSIIRETKRLELAITRFESRSGQG